MKTSEKGKVLYELDDDRRHFNRSFRNVTVQDLIYIAANLVKVVVERDDQHTVDSVVKDIRMITTNELIGGTNEQESSYRNN